MADAGKQLDVHALTIDERLDLIGRLWDSMEPDELTVPESHLHELERRLAAADADPGASMPWEEVRRRLRGER